MNYLVILVITIFISICSTTFTYSDERRYRRQDIAEPFIDSVDNTKQGQDEINPSTQFINKEETNVNKNNGFKALDVNKSPDDSRKDFNFGGGFPFGQGWPFGQGGKQNLNSTSESTIKDINLVPKELNTSTSSDGSSSSASGFPFFGNLFPKKLFSFGSGWPFNQDNGQTGMNTNSFPGGSDSSENNTPFGGSNPSSGKGFPMGGGFPPAADIFGRGWPFRKA